MFEKSSHGPSQWLRKIFMAPIHRAHRAVIFAIAQLSCLHCNRWIFDAPVDLAKTTPTWGGIPKLGGGSFPKKGAWIKPSLWNDPCNYTSWVKTASFSLILIIWKIRYSLRFVGNLKPRTHDLKQMLANMLLSNNVGQQMLANICVIMYGNVAVGNTLPATATAFCYSFSVVKRKGLLVELVNTRRAVKEYAYWWVKGRTTRRPIWLTLKCKWCYRYRNETHSW